MYFELKLGRMVIPNRILFTSDIIRRKVLLPWLFALSENLNIQKINEKQHKSIKKKTLLQK